jgi:hypothetical protein
MSASNSKTNFLTTGLELTGDRYNKVAQIDGREWVTKYWDTDSLRRLERTVSAGLAEISECHGTDGNFWLKMTVQPEVARAELSRIMFFENLLAAAETAEVFAWEVKEHGGVKWYRTDSREDGYTKWEAVLGEGDTVELYCDKGGDFHMKRDICICYGVSYEMTARRYDNGDSKHAVRTFAEAAAIAITLPSFLAVLGATNTHLLMATPVLT